jgi:hypothetical protein
LGVADIIEGLKIGRPGVSALLDVVHQVEHGATYFQEFTRTFRNTKDVCRCSVSHKTECPNFALVFSAKVGVCKVGVRWRETTQKNIFFYYLFLPSLTLTKQYDTIKQVYCKFI